MDLTKLSDAELRAMLGAPEPQANLPAPGATPIAQRRSNDLSTWSDADLIAHRDGMAAEPSTFDALKRGVGQGANIGLADEMEGLGAASGFPDWTRVVPGARYLAGGTRLAAEKIAPGTFGRAATDRYDAAVTREREGDRQAQEAHPWAYGGGQVVGGVASAIPMAAAAPARFGVAAGQSLGSRALWGGLSGSMLGGAQGVGEGEGSIADRLPNAGLPAAVGTGFGVLGPVAGAGVAAGSRALSNAVGPSLMNLGRAASRDLLGAFEGAGGAGAVPGRAARLGPDAMMLDLGEPFVGRAKGLATMPGEASERIVSTLRARNDGTNARLSADLDGAFGPAPTPSRVSAGIDASQEALGPDYGRVMAGASRVDTSALAERLEAGIVNTRGDAQRAMRQVRADLDVPGNPGNLDPSPQALLSSRQAIDGRLRTEADPNTIRVLTMARQEIDGELARAVPGIKAVDAQYAELARQNTALTRGGQTLDSGKTAIRPGDLAQEITAGAQPQSAMVGPSAAPFRLRQGARAEVDRVVGTEANDLAALRRYVKGEGDWNRDKLAQVFGADEAERVFRAIDRETAFRDAFVKVSEGSQTAQREGGRAAMAVRDVKPSASDAGLTIAGAAGGPLGFAGAAALKAGRIGANLLGRGRDLGRNDDVARALVMSGSERDALLADLVRGSGRMGEARSAADQRGRVAQILMSGSGRNDETEHLTATGAARARALGRAVLGVR